MSCEKILSLTADFLIEHSDVYKDGWLLDKVLLKLKKLNKKFQQDPKIGVIVERRRKECVEEYSPREWKEYNKDYEERAMERMAAIFRCKQRPLLSWGAGPAACFLEHHG